LLVHLSVEVLHTNQLVSFHGFRKYLLLKQMLVPFISLAILVQAIITILSYLAHVFFLLLPK